SDVESMSFIGPTTLEGWKGVPIRERLEAATGLPLFFGADVAAAALGERLYGVGIALRQFYYLYLGVGLGGTMVQDGVVIRGAHGNAGEIGHFPLVPDGDVCSCGNRGCLERYLSLEALGRRLGVGDPLVALDALARTPSANLEAWIRDTAPLLQRTV